MESVLIDDEVDILIVALHEVFLAGKALQFLLVALKYVKGGAVGFYLLLVILLFCPHIAKGIQQLHLVDDAVPVEEHQPQEKYDKSYGVLVFQVWRQSFEHSTNLGL